MAAVRVYDGAAKAADATAQSSHLTPTQTQIGCSDHAGTTTTQQRPDPSFGPVDLRAFSRPIVKDGLIYYVDANSGLYVVRYTGPHADQIPAQGICVTGNIMQAGFEPCPPYGGS